MRAKRRSRQYELCAALLAMILCTPPASADAPVYLFTIPGWKHQVYLDNFMPMAIHNVWTMVAVGILTVFLIRGLCDYFGNYLVNYVGLSAVTDLRQDVFDRVVHQDAHFFESNSTARVMSSIMNDLEKIQVAMSHILADLLRQSFTLLFLAAAVMRTDWKLATGSLTLLPFVLIPTLRLGRRIRRTTRSAQDNTAELNQVLQETLSGHQVVKSFGAEEIESNRFRDRAERLRNSNLHYVAQQAIAVEFELVPERFAGGPEVGFVAHLKHRHHRHAKFIGQSPRGPVSTPA